MPARLTLDITSLPRSVSEARASGVRHFFTGQPCRHGHLVPRSVSNGVCMECRRIMQRENFHNVKPDGPVSANGKMQAIAQRLMRGENLFRVLDSIFGAKAILCRRVKVSPSMFTQARGRGYLSDELAPRVASVLNVPLSRVPTRLSRLARVTAALRTGLEFHDAIYRHRAGTDLCLALGLSGSTIHGWRKRGVPKRHVTRIAKLLACSPSLIPVSRGCVGRPLSERDIQQLSAVKKTEEYRAKMRDAALRRTRNSQGNRWVKKDDQQKSAPRYRDVLDRIAGTHGFSGSSSLA